MSRISLLDPSGELTPKLVTNLLEMVGANPQHVGRWSATEMRIAYDWAIREHLHAGDGYVRRRPKPWFIEAGRS
jgi:hypothetical protein